MAWVMVGVAAFQVVNGMQQAEVIREQGKIARDIANMNAEFAEVDAWHAEQDGQKTLAQYEGQVEQVISTQRNEFAAKDVDASFGSAAEVIADSKLAGMLNGMDIVNQAHEKALGYKREARSTRLGGATQMAQANLSASATQGAAIAQGVGTAGSAVAGYQKTKQPKKV